MERRKPHTEVIDGVPRDPHVDPNIFRERLQFRAQKGDMELLSYPKSGTHWVIYIVQLILKRGEPVNSYAEFVKNMRFLGFLSFETWTPSLPLRLFVRHFPLKKEAIDTEAKYICLTRNPWDVCVSFFHMTTNLSAYKFQDGTFEEFFDAFLSSDVAGYGNYFDHVVSAYAIKDEPNVLFLTYEELMEDTRGTILKMARFLGNDYARDLERNEQLFQTLLARCTADNMRHVLVGDLRGSSIPECTKHLRRLGETCKVGYNGDSTKYCLVREAKVGGWKKYFSSKQLQRMEAAIRRVEEVSPVMDLWKNIRDEAIAAYTASK